MDVHYWILAIMSILFFGLLPFVDWQIVASDYRMWATNKIPDGVNEMSDQTVIPGTIRCPIHEGSTLSIRSISCNDFNQSAYMDLNRRPALHTEDTHGYTYQGDRCKCEFKAVGTNVQLDLVYR